MHLRCRLRPLHGNAARGGVRLMGAAMGDGPICASALSCLCSLSAGLLQLPPVVCSLGALCRLDLSQNLLSALPASIRSLSALGVPASLARTVLYTTCEYLQALPPPLTAPAVGRLYRSR